MKTKRVTILKLICLLVCVALTSSNVLALNGTIYWNDSTANHSWGTVANWTPLDSNPRVPDATDWAAIQSAGVNTPVINSAGATCFYAFVGLNSGVGALNVTTGGNLTTANDIYLGWFDVSAGAASMNISGGVVQCGSWPGHDFYVGGTGSGTAALTMSAGTLDAKTIYTSGAAGITSTFDLSGGAVSTGGLNLGYANTGTLDMTGGQLVASWIALGFGGGEGIISLDGGFIATSDITGTLTDGYIDITAGELRLAGNWTTGANATTLNNYITATTIRAYGGAGTVNVAYNSDRGETFVTGVVPEPCTLAILGLGAVIAGFRKRR